MSLSFIALSNAASRHAASRRQVAIGAPVSDIVRSQMTDRTHVLRASTMLLMGFFVTDPSWFLVHISKLERFRKYFKPDNDQLTYDNDDDNERVRIYAFYLLNEASLRVCPWRRC